MGQFFIFDTAFGSAGLAWTSAGLTRVAFPQADEDNICEVLSKDKAREIIIADAPSALREVAEKTAALFEGKVADFRDVVLDEGRVTSFDRDVLGFTRNIPYGETRSYGAIARALGDVGWSRRVGQALGRNPWPIVVPCHRVVGSDGRMTGFSAPGGALSKHRLLKLEGALAPDLFD